MITQSMTQKLKEFIHMITKQERKENPELKFALQRLLLAMEQCR